MSSREEDIKIICEAVIEDFMQYEYDANSYDKICCVFCGSYVWSALTFEDKHHELHCPYLVAKDLMAGL